jgi:hypothetical protein
MEARPQTAVETANPTANGNDPLKIGYEQLCKSHGEIDSFRSTLLHLLPVASAGGILLLLNKDVLGENVAAVGATANSASPHALLLDLLGPIGIFGLVVTLGFFAYEVYGIRKCHAIILAAKAVEARLAIPGPFSTRPRELLGFINEPLAAGIIYPAVLAAWTFVGLYSTARSAGPWIACFTFLFGFAAMLGYNFYLKQDAEARPSIKNLSKRMVQAEEIGDPKSLEPLLAPGFKIRRADGKTYDRKQYLDDVPAKKDRGRSVDRVDVQVAWRKAVLTCRVTTTRKADGSPGVGHFKNTQQFVQRGGEWQCTGWQVEEMADA